MRFYFHDSRCVKFCHHFRIEILINKLNIMAVGLISYQTLSCRLLNRMISHQSVSTICSFTRALSRRTSSPYTDLSPRTVHGLVGYTWLTTLKTRIKCVYRLKRGMTNSLKTYHCTMYLSIMLTYCVYLCTAQVNLCGRWTFRTSQWLSFYDSRSFSSLPPPPPSGDKTKKTGVCNVSIHF